jgi:hypothetical protein
MKDNKHIQRFNEHQENLNISDVSHSLIMNGTLHTKVEIIKYDGSNKDYIINRLGIKEYTKTYFKTTPSYFIIPNSEKEWFILGENQFNRMVTVD